MERFVWHRCNLAAKENELECICVSNDNFGGGGRHHWVSMCTVWILHSKWLSRATNLHQNYALSLNIPLQKLFRRPQLWATGDWQLHHYQVSIHASRLVQSCSGETPNHPGDSAPYSPDSAPYNFWLFPKLKSPLKGKWFSDSWWDSGKYERTADGD